MPWKCLSEPPWTAHPTFKEIHPFSSSLIKPYRSKHERGALRVQILGLISDEDAAII